MTLTQTRDPAARTRAWWRGCPLSVAMIGGTDSVALRLRIQSCGQAGAPATAYVIFDSVVPAAQRLPFAQNIRDCLLAAQASSAPPPRACQYPPPVTPPFWRHTWSAAAALAVALIGTAAALGYWAAP